jgi:beta-galactosidase
MKNLKFNTSLYILLSIFMISKFSFQSIAQYHPEVKMYGGVPALFINDELYPPFAYMSYLGEKKYYKEIEAAGIHIYNIPAYLGDRGINSTSGIGPFRSSIWIGDNKYDFSSLIKDFEEIINSDPKAKVIIRLYLDPPIWWEKSNPEASGHLPDGSTFRQCFASNKWREETGKVFQHVIKWLTDSPYYNYLIGIQPAAGDTEEWFYHPKQFNCDNPANVKAFRKWLITNYNHDTLALQNSWNNPGVTFNSAQLANTSDPEIRMEWRDPGVEQNYIDTYRYRSELLVDNICFFSKIIKETTNGKLLTGAFSGYHYWVTDPRRGHGALARLLECEYIDYLSSPNVYHRVLGEDWPPMLAVKSLQLHGKLWLAENDTRTSITTLLKDRSTGIAPPGGWYETSVWHGPEDMETSISFLWKNAGRMLTEGYGGWWFDMWGGWFSDPELLNVIEKTQEYYKKHPQQEGEKMQSQVLVIVDEELSFWDASLGRLSESILSNRFPLAKTGAPHDLYLRTDLDKIQTDQYKVIWLMGILELNNEEIIKIEKWRHQGITVLWTDGNGTTIYDQNEKGVFCSEKFRWSDTQLRELWKRAGVHSYIETDDVLYIGRNWLCIHTVIGGDRIIQFPFKAQIIDPLNQQIIENCTNYIEINISPKSTTILRINPY